MASTKSFTVRVTRNDLLKLAAVADEAAAAAVKEAAEAMATDARQRAPVDTGYMRDHTQAERRDDAHYEVRARAPYSGFVDMGTHRMPAQPWFTPAAEKARAEWPDRLARAVGDALKKVG